MGIREAWHSVSPRGSFLPKSLLYSCSFLHPPAVLSCPAASSSSYSVVHHRFHLPAWCHSGLFCTYLVSQRQARVGIPIWLLKLDNGDESRLRVLILTGVAQGQRVGLQDKSKGNSDPGAQHCNGWLELTANSVPQGRAKNV